MKLAIVHDWFIRPGGAERVLVRLHHLWPDAPIYMILADPAMVRAYLPRADVRTSGLQRLPMSQRLYPYLAPLMPSAVEGFDLSGYDTVLSSSVTFSKGVIVRPGTRHICYCYSPSRMLWDRAASYERRGIAQQLIRHALRSWDVAAARRPDQMIAISQTIASRISTYYRRDSLVIPPPIRMPEVVPPTSGDYFLVVSRILPHKNLAMLLEAFGKLRYPLVIVGDGPSLNATRTHAAPSITFTGWVSDTERDRLYAGCRAVIIPNEEDFGLTAVEAMAHGKPVLALRKGGATETVLEGITGEFFDDPIPAGLADGIRRLQASYTQYAMPDIRAHALQWSEEYFDARMRAVVEPS